MIFKADMHIHSVLSPCGDIEMSPSAIVAKAKERGMDIIGLPGSSFSKTTLTASATSSWWTRRRTYSTRYPIC